MRLIARLAKEIEGLRAFFKPQPYTQVPFAFAISKNGRDEYRYVEDDKFLVFYAELLTGSIQRDLDKNSIQEWLPPHEQEIITEAERERIFQNICAYFDRNGITYQI